MKIEKLNEDKIRITLNIDDLKENDIDFHSFMSNSLESQELFLTMLDKAEKEVGFVTENYKVMIEALAMSNGSFVLTITRILEDKFKVNTYKRKNVNFKRKLPTLDSSKVIYAFKTFDEFCEYCEFLNNDILKHINEFLGNDALYEYNEEFYLVLENLKMNANLLKAFASSITEFARFVSHSDLFEHKLLEYGNVIFKDHAISNCLKHFC